MNKKTFPLCTMAVSTVLICLGIVLPMVSALESVAYIMREETPSGMIIGDIKSDAVLEDQFIPEDYQRLVFSILTQVDGDVMSGNYFEVEESTGILKVLNPLDRDELDICAFMKHCVMSFDVAVGPEDIFRVISVRVEVEDINDNSPVFGLNEMNLNISELAGTGSSYQLPVVSDRDGDSYGVSKMSVSPASGQFAVRWMRGSDGRIQPRLELLQPVDREQVTTFGLTITASDGGSPPRTAILLVHVDVLDANDNIPQFQQAGYEVTVPEDGRRGRIIIKVKADDPDLGYNGDVMYKMAETTTKQYGEVFQIDESTGIITLAGSLDREELDVYYLTVLAVDRGEDKREASSTVTVYVEDKNDNSPVIRISTLTESGLARVVEGSDVGTFVALLSVKDQDWGRNSDVTCTLNTGDFRLEALQPNKFKIVTGVRIDREYTYLYNIEIFCNDQGEPQMSSAAMVTVQVDDVNDHSPVFKLDDVSMHVTENSHPGTVIGQILATDEDFDENGRVTYFTIEAFSTRVSVEEDTGVISTISSIDREDLEKFVIYVIASDHGNPALSATATVTVLVDDVNDMVPVFTQASYTFVVTENDNNRRELARLVATDGDNPPYNEIRYSLRGANAYFLAIEPENGTLYAVRPLDREMMSYLEVQVVATDMENPSFIGLANVTVYVGDVNDHVPRIIFPSPSNNTMVISSQLGKDDTVGWIQALDDDFGLNAVLEYFLTFPRRDGDDLFTIDIQTGIITVVGDLSAVADDVMQCVVVVKDGGIPSLSASENCTIIVNSTLGLAEPTKEDTDFQMNITIVIVVVASTLVLVAILLGAIVFMYRRARTRRRRNKPRYAVEKMGAMVAQNGQLDLHGCNSDDKDVKAITKIYNPKTGQDVDRESLRSGEGSTTDSGRGASEEGEHGEHDRSVSSRHNESSEAKSSSSVFPGADDSIITGQLDLSTSFDHNATLPRRAPKNKNVTFEDDVMIAEIPDFDQNIYGENNTPRVYDQYGERSPYGKCPAIRYPSPDVYASNDDMPYHSTDTQPYQHHDPWSPDSATDYSTTEPTQRRTVRNVKARDRSKRQDTLTAMHDSADMQSDPNISHSYNRNGPYDFTDSNSLLRYKLHGTNDSASEINSAASTTSGSYVIQTDDLRWDCNDDSVYTDCNHDSVYTDCNHDSVYTIHGTDNSMSEV